TWCRRRFRDDDALDELHDEDRDVQQYAGGRGCQGAGSRDVGGRQRRQQRRLAQHVMGARRQRWWRRSAYHDLRAAVGDQKREVGVTVTDRNGSYVRFAEVTVGEESAQRFEVLVRPR